MTIARLVQTHNAAYTQAVVQGGGLAANAARTAAETVYGFEQMRTRATLLRDRADAVKGRADADGATLADLFLYLAANKRHSAASVRLSATSGLATSAGCDAEADVYDTAAIRTVSTPAADGFESVLSDAAEEAARAHAEHAEKIAAAEQALTGAEANLVQSIGDAEETADLAPVDVLDVRREVYVAALDAAKARATVRAARLAAALAAAEAEAEAYDIAEDELQRNPNPWTDVASDDADL